jgi:hypothetical protein
MTKTVKTKPTTLPSAEDSNWDRVFGSGKELARIRGYVEQKRPLWWALWGFSGRFAGLEPKWHVFAARTRSTDPEDRWSFTWVAMCGYVSKRSALIDGEPRTKVQAPKKADRCTRCEKALKEIREAGRAAASSGE